MTYNINKDHYDSLIREFGDIEVTGHLVFNRKPGGIFEWYVFWELRETADDHIISTGNSPEAAVESAYKFLTVSH